MGSFLSRSSPDVGHHAVKTVTGRMRLSTPEATALDLLRSVAAAGSLSTVATVAPRPGRALRRGPARRGGPDRRAASWPAPRASPGPGSPGAGSPTRWRAAPHPGYWMRLDPGQPAR